MAYQGFIFDIIIVRIDTPNHHFPDASKLMVSVRFNNTPLMITSSRINVAEFKSGRSYEFDAVPEELKRDLVAFPLTLHVEYNFESIGEGSMPWPKSFVERINDSTGELTHVGELELKISDEKVGTVEIIVRLQCKCQEVDDAAKDECALQLDKMINPHDMLFLVGKNKHACDLLLADKDDDEEMSQDDTCGLDLSKFRNKNGKLMQTPAVLNTCMTAGCCELKKISNQYQVIIDSLGTCCPSPSKGKHNKHRIPKTPCRKCEQRSSSCSSTESSVQECECEKPPCVCAANTHSRKSKGYGAETPINVCPSNTPKHMQDNVKKSRQCPVCKDDVSWLPKLACCPKCGYKPIPVCRDKCYNEKLTAEEVLAEFLDKNTSNSEEEGCPEEMREQCEEKKECRCTCKFGKVCAHCRIRKLCADIFKGNATADQAADKNCGKCEPSSSDVYNICKTESNDCRPYLARVFSELRDLYDIKERQKSGFEINSKCEAELQGNEKQKEHPPKKHDPRKELAQIVQKRNTLRSFGGQSNAVEDAGNKKPFKTEDKYKDQKDSGLPKLRRRRRCKGGQDDCCPKRVNRYVLCPRQRCPKIYETSNQHHKNVPSHMGWLWKVGNNAAYRRGWKPGAIRKPIKELMKYFLKDFPVDTIRVSQYAYRHTDAKTCQELEKQLHQQPTLHICKKNDTYMITMRPLKDPDALKVCADPYLNMKPIQFKITKNPLLTQIRNIKRCLKEMGFKKCTCHRPIAECCCRTYLDKKRLEYQTNKECRKRKLENCTCTLVLSDTSESDVEFDFGVTPPAGVIKPERLRKPNFVNHGTQYCEGDWNKQPVFCKNPNKYMKDFNCATGLGYGPGAPLFGGNCWCPAKTKGKPKTPFGPFGKDRNPLPCIPKKKGDGKVDMLKYVSDHNKKLKEQVAAGLIPCAAERRKLRLAMLAGHPPPLLSERNGGCGNTCYPCNTGIC